MHKALVISVVFLAIAFVGTAAWFGSEARQSQAQSDQYAQWAKAQKLVPVHFEITVPPETPANQMLYISGDASQLGNWDGAGVPLARGADGKYRGTVELVTGIAHAFKVTRGTWGTVERGAGGAEIADHAFNADKEMTIDSTVLSWVDNGKTIPGRITTTGDIRLHKKFHSNILGDERNIIVYLPPGYEQTGGRGYPVLYMHDGQNLFDSSTSYAGIEWGVDETAQKMIIDGKMEPVIIVGIYNAGDYRTEQFIGPKKELYGRFVCEEVKPFIDRTYHTIPDRAHTAMAGSSMGALTTLYIVKAHPGVFSKIALFDPFLRNSAGGPEGQKLLIAELFADPSWAKGMFWFVDMGTDPAGNYPGKDPIADGRALEAALQAAGLQSGKDFTYHESQGATHNETGWAQRIDRLLLALYGKGGAS